MTQFNPWPKNKFLRGLCYIWSAPLMMFVLPVVGILWCAEQITNRGWKDGAWEFEVAKGSWLYNKIVDKWDAFSFGWCILYVEEYDFQNVTVRIHERVHLQQQLYLGLFQWIFYGLFYLIILVVTKLDPYLANIFEIAARSQAGQEIGDLARKGNAHFYK